MKKVFQILSTLLVLFLVSCKEEKKRFDYFKSDVSGVKNGGVKMITIDTPKGKFAIFRQKVMATIQK